MKKFSTLLPIFISIVAALAIIGYALAQIDNVNFPIAELGNCQDKDACKKYCDEPVNVEACINFAEKNNLMSNEEASLARKITSGELKGPGGCTTKDKCEAFCDDVKNIDECVTFAEQNQVMPAEELAEAKKIRDAIKQGVKPPNCRNKKECDNYCSVAEHMEECMNFALKAGFMSEGERADAEKMLAAIKNGVKPPACRGKEECDKYCSTDDHIEECADFALKAGFIQEKDYELMKKTKGRGPGGCKGREECESFCNNPANQQACFDFAKENNLIPEEELQKMEEGKRTFMENISNAPPEVKACLQEKLGDLSNVKPTRENGEKMKECFEKLPGGPDGVGAGSQPRTGPGGCRSQEECEAYCREHRSECGAPPSGSSGSLEGFSIPPSGGSTGPGGCKSQTECEAYCREHPRECGESMPSEGGSYQERQFEGTPPPAENYPSPVPTGEVRPPEPTPSALMDLKTLLGLAISSLQNLLK